ncbi:hypothetical protein V6U89_17915 [Micromonospora sp. CPCC 206171]|uniref:hypothetical protein n=1 Tax=Micromonospora sp. CPCC 206171 TaxID=3122405 RepID=UPI002FF2124E
MALILAVVGLLAIFAPNWQSTDTGGPAPTASAEVRTGSDKRLCSIEHIRCGSVELGGGSITEYAILAAASGPGRGLVLVELGGPGVDLFTRSGIDSLGLPAAIAGYDVLLLREPWTRRDRPQDCLGRLNQFGAEVSAGRPAAVAVDEGRCKVPVWTSSSYQAAVKAITSAEGRPLVGVVGQSFGALPAVAAARTMPDAWLLLNAPIAPPGQTGRALLKQRADVLTESLDRSYADECRALGLDCRLTGSQVVSNAAARVGGRMIGGRTRPMGAGDVDLAAIAAAYDLDANQRWLWRTLTALPALDDRDWATIGRLADQLLQRFDSQKISPKLGAYVAGMCASYDHWAPDSGLPVFFRALAGQCQIAGRATDGWSAILPVTAPQRRAPTCVLVNDHDTVVAPGWAEQWGEMLPRSTVRHYRYRGHVPLVQAVAMTRTACGILDARQAGTPNKIK